MYRLSHPFSLSVASLALALLGVASVSAFSAASTNYRLDNGTLNTFGGPSSSTNYQLTSSGGEPFIGPGSSTNYKLNSGQIAALEQSISLTLDSLSVAIPQVTSGTSKTAFSQVSVLTDASGYLLAASQNQDMTASDSSTIPAFPSAIATPGLWTEGTSIGLGFSLTAGTSLDAKWGTSPAFKYAAFPASSTTIHDKPGYTSGPDVTTVQYRLDVSATQKPGSYSNIITYTATIKP